MAWFFIRDALQKVGLRHCRRLWEERAGARFVTLRGNRVSDRGSQGALVSLTTRCLRCPSSSSFLKSQHSIYAVVLIGDKVDEPHQ